MEHTVHKPLRPKQKKFQARLLTSFLWCVQMVSYTIVPGPNGDAWIEVQPTLEARLMLIETLPRRCRPVA